MKKLFVIFVLSGVGLSLAAAAIAARPARDKNAIAALEDRIAKAVEAKDANAIMANYTPGDTLVVFDLIPPREYRGWDAYLKDWQGILAGCADKPKMEISDLATESAGGLAYSHSVQHFACTDAKGNKVDLTMRTTDVYRKSSGKWLIVHEHNSVPVDIATAKADMNSTP
jgi:uncharacterized protein (TIGR02246 family)